MCAQYIRGRSVHQGVFSTSGDIMSTSRRYHECIGGISWVHQGEGGCSVHQGDIMSTSGDVQYIGGYHEYIGGMSWCMWGISWVHQGFQYKLKGFCHLAPLTCIMISPEHPPMYSWYPPNVLMESPDVLNIPWCNEHTLYRVITSNNDNKAHARKGKNSMQNIFQILQKIQNLLFTVKN